jgi:hypothetical protein
MIRIHALNPETERAAVWQFSHPEAAVDYWFVFSDTATSIPLEFQFEARGEKHVLGIRLPARSAAVIRIEEEIITSALIKGSNEETGETVVPACSLDGSQLTAPTPGDWYYEAADRLPLTKTKRSGSPT